MKFILDRMTIKTIKEVVAILILIAITVARLIFNIKIDLNLLAIPGMLFGINLGELFMGRSNGSYRDYNRRDDYDNDGYDDFKDVD